MSACGFEIDSQPLLKDVNNNDYDESQESDWSMDREETTEGDFTPQEAITPKKTNIESGGKNDTIMDQPPSILTEPGHTGTGKSGNLRADPNNDNTPPSKSTDTSLYNESQLMKFTFMDEEDRKFCEELEQKHIKNMEDQLWKLTNTKITIWEENE